jgi:transposase
MKYGVNFRRPKYTFWKSIAENEDLKKKQYEFVCDLLSIIKNRSYDEILYIDETTFHLWQKARKCWIRNDMKLNLVRNRGPSITVIGAISQERGLVYFEVFEDNNNSDLFSNFIRGLKSNCEGRRVVVIMDNLRIHYTKKLDEVYDDDFKVMFLPTYSSELNPIETLWSMLKRKWTHVLHLFGEELSKERQMRRKINLI